MSSDSLEAQLARLVEEAHASEHIRRQLIAFRFYLLKTIDTTIENWRVGHHGRTRCASLLNYLYRWQRRTGAPVLLATFNYDEILDHALRGILGEWDFKGSLPRYIARRDFRLFKLRGSTDWSRASSQNELSPMVKHTDPRDLLNPPALEQVVGKDMPAAATNTCGAGHPLEQGRIETKRAPTWTPRQLNPPGPFPGDTVATKQDAIRVPALAIQTASKYGVECRPGTRRV